MLVRPGRPRRFPTPGFAHFLSLLNYFCRPSGGVWWAHVAAGAPVQDSSRARPGAVGSADLRVQERCTRVLPSLRRFVASSWAPWALLAVVGVVHVLVTRAGADPFAMVDLDVYVQGGRHLTDGTLYDFVTQPLELPFTYPPFSALIFVPLGWLNWTVARILWQLASFGALAVIVHSTLRLLGRAGAGARRPMSHVRGIVVTATALGLWLEPVGPRSTTARSTCSWPRCWWPVRRPRDPGGPEARWAWRRASSWSRRSPGCTTCCSAGTPRHSGRRRRSRRRWFSWSRSFRAKPGGTSPR